MSAAPGEVTGMSTSLEVAPGGPTGWRVSRCLRTLIECAHTITVRSILALIQFLLALSEGIYCAVGQLAERNQRDDIHGVRIFR